MRLKADPGALLTLAALLLILNEGDLLPFLAALLIHESGHLAAVCACGLRPEELRAELGGFTIKYEGGGYIKDAAVAFAGPAASLTAALCSSLLNGPRFFTGLNAVFAVFNLLPISGLDGERALRSLISVFLPAEKVYRITLLSELFCLSALFYFGAAAALRHSNYTFLISAAYLCLMCCKKR